MRKIKTYKDNIIDILKQNERQLEQRGLGDSIEYLTEITKIKALVEKAKKMTGTEDCGCKKRKEKLNKMFPYKK